MGIINSSKINLYFSIIATVIVFIFEISLISAAAPSVGIINPVSGESLIDEDIIFTTTVSDPDGYDDLVYQYFVINEKIETPMKVWLEYSPNGKFFRIRDGVGYTTLDSCYEGQDKIIENPYVRLDCKNSKGTAVDSETISIEWKLSFKDSMGGSFNSYLYAKDKSGTRTGWQKKGTYIVREVANRPPEVGEIDPYNADSLFNEEVIINTKSSDPDGYEDLVYQYFVINEKIETPMKVWLEYSPNGKFFRIRDGVGYTTLDSCYEGQDKIIENPYVRLDCKNSKRVISQDFKEVNVEWHLYFKDSMEGDYNMYLYSKDISGVRTGWQKKGTCIIRAVTNRPPEAGTVDPWDSEVSTDEDIIFTTTVSDPDGYDDLVYQYFVINEKIETPMKVWLEYSPNGKFFRIRDGVGYTTLDSCHEGQDKIIENPYVRLDCKNSKGTAVDSETVSIEWKLSFKESMKGSHNLYLYAKDKAGIRTYWQNEGDLDIIKSNPFIEVRGSEFYLNGEPYYFAGTNGYYLWYGDLDCIDTQTNQGCVNEFLDDVKENGLTVVRTWGSSEGVNKYGFVFQPSKGVYDESTFAHFDSVLKQAGDRDIKLIVTLVNNWQDFGGIDRYNSWCGISGHDNFYTNECTKQAYRDYVNYFLNHENSITGVKYKDDPTIFSWELANEPRCRSDTTGETLNNWIGEMSTYIKSIDSNHLVTTGVDGGYVSKEGYPDWNWWYFGKEGQNFISNHEWDSVDFATFHYYDDPGKYDYVDVYSWIQEHIEDSHNILGKPVVFEEFNTIGDKESVLADWYSYMENLSIDGDTFWMLSDNQFIGNDDGFFVNCPEDAGVCSVIQDHAGFMNSRTESNF